MTAITDEQLARSCTFYGISIEEGRRRHERIMSHADSPEHPICVGCASTPDELPLVVELARESKTTPDQFVRREEGTFNHRNGHFLCDDCYIRNGMPSSERGWTCP